MQRDRRWAALGALAGIVPAAVLLVSYLGALAYIAIHRKRYAQRIYTMLIFFVLLGGGIIAGTVTFFLVPQILYLIGVILCGWQWEKPAARKRADRPHLLGKAAAPRLAWDRA